MVCSVLGDIVLLAVDWRHSSRVIACCSKKVLLLRNLQSYDKMATYRVAGWFGLVCRSIDSSTLVAYPSPFMRQSVAVTVYVEFH